MLIISFLGGENNITRIYRLCVLLYIPSALSYSKIDWLGFFNIPIKFESSLPFTYTLILGSLIPTCYLLLTCTAWYKSAHTDLIRRGGYIKEIDNVLSKQLFFSFLTPIICGLVSLMTAFLFMATEPVVIGFIEDVPYPHLVIGACGVLILFICIYYHLTEITKWGVDSLRQLVLTELSEPEAITLSVLVKSNMVSEEEFVEKLKNLLNHDSFRVSDLRRLLLKIAMKSNRLGYEKLYSSEWRIVNGEYRFFYFLTREAYRSIIREALKERAIY